MLNLCRKNEYFIYAKKILYIDIKILYIYIYTHIFKALTYLINKNKETRTWIAAVLTYYSIETF